MPRCPTKCRPHYMSPKVSPQIWNRLKIGQWSCLQRWLPVMMLSILIKSDRMNFLGGSSIFSVFSFCTFFVFFSCFRRFFDFDRIFDSFFSNSACTWKFLLILYRRRFVRQDFRLVFVYLPRLA